MAVQIQEKDIDIASYVSLIASLLLCAGILAQSTYYLFFNVPITEFLSITEILTLFAQDVIRYILVFCILLLWSYLSTVRKTKRSSQRAFLQFVKLPTKSARFIEYIKYRKKTVYYYLFGFVIAMSLLFEKDKIAYIFCMYFAIEVFYFFTRFFRFEYLRDLRKAGKLKKNNETFDTMFQFALHFLFFVVIWSMIDAQRVKYEQKFINVSIKLRSDSLIKSDSMRFYIGQTEKHVFFYNLRIDQTTVYPKDDIKEMVFGKINYIPQSKNK